MKIIYSKREKSPEGELKRSVHFGLECLLLTFVMCTLVILLMVKNMRTISYEGEYQEVSNNVIFEMIELEVKETPAEKSVSNDTSDQVVDFWELFEKRQKENNG